MDFPSLSVVEERSWQALRSLEDEDLFAMLGAQPTYDQPSSTADFLLLGIKFEKNREIIVNGKRRLRRILDAAKKGICEMWSSVNKHKRVFDEKAVVAIVAEGIRKILDIDPSLPFIPTVLLVCRACSYSLDALCTKQAPRTKQ